MIPIIPITAPTTKNSMVRSMMPRIKDQLKLKDTLHLELKPRKSVIKANEAIIPAKLIRFE